ELVVALDMKRPSRTDTISHGEALTVRGDPGAQAVISPAAGHPGRSGVADGLAGWLYRTRTAFLQYRFGRGLPALGERCPPRFGMGNPVPLYGPAPDRRDEG